MNDDDEGYWEFIVRWRIKWQEHHLFEDAMAIVFHWTWRKRNENTNSHHEKGTI